MAFKALPVSSVLSPYLLLTEPPANVFFLFFFGGTVFVLRVSHLQVILLYSSAATPPFYLLWSFLEM
jgi:hypothetical protein